MNHPNYGSTFYDTFADESMSAAHGILPIVQSAVNPRTVVDVGCGVGTWLKVWMELGVPEVQGIDGDYVNLDQLLIPKGRFLPMDLKASNPSAVGQFDLVESLEVGEHLPAEVADSFVGFLCSMAPVVLFSAAIPHQGGSNHINEQWPQYRADLFAKRGFVPVDAIRHRVGEDPKVAYYYAQNTFVYVRSDQVELLNKLRALAAHPVESTTALVHPRKWHEINERAMSLGRLVRMLPASVADYLARPLGKMRRSRSSGSTQN